MFAPQPVPLSSAGVSFLASALLPGAGQYVQGKERWVPYLAVEAFAWLSYLKQSSRGRSLEREYRDLAWLVARRIDALARRDTSFGYYEAMADFHKSGAFDADPRLPGIQPEPDTLTYNGRQWQRAKALFLPLGIDFPPGTTQFERALAYYLRTAIPPGYGWSWGESNLEQQVFQRLIVQSDQAVRSARRTLGLILANHVLSAVDALVTARLQAVGQGNRQIRFGSEMYPMAGSVHWRTTVRFPLPRK